MEYKIKAYKKVSVMLNKIFKQIHKLNPESAVKITNRIIDHLEFLKKWPEAYPVLNWQMEYEPPREYRKLSIMKDYIAFYFIRGDEVHITNLVFASSNWTAMRLV